MPTYTEPVRPLEFLITEGEGAISRKIDTVASGAGVLVPGRVMARRTSDSKLVPYDGASGTAGVNVAVSILAYDVDATSADQTVLTIAYHAEVMAETQPGGVSWGSNSAPNIAAGKTALENQKIFVRA